MTEVIVQSILKEIQPEEQSDGSIYSRNLEGSMATARQNKNELWSRYEDADEGSIAIMDYAVNLARISLLETALDQQLRGRNPALHAKRFTESSKELFGEPDPLIAIGLLRAQLVDLSESDDWIAYPILKEVSDLITPGEVSVEDDTELSFSKIELEELKESLYKFHADAIELIDGLPEGSFSPKEVRSILTEILETRATEDTSWSEWSVTNRSGKTMMSVLAKEKEIDVPDGRVDVGSRLELKTLLVHELGHALRAKNGYDLDDELMAFGLPQYDLFEEGAMIFSESLVCDSVPEKAVDRYVDISLALGSIGVQLSREQLIEFAYARNQIRAFGGRVASEEPLSEYREKAKTHVNRIFRGGDGIRYEDSGGVQSVFTKDAIYYSGYVDAVKFFKQKMGDGMAAEDIWTYLYSGKFNPLVSEHVEYINSKGVLL